MLMHTDMLKGTPNSVFIVRYHDGEVFIMAKAFSLLVDAEQFAKEYPGTCVINEVELVA